MRFGIKTLGCKMNQLDSARVAASFSAAGWREVEPEQAEIVLVNSCTVTASAEKKSLTEAKKFARAGKQVVVFGCSPRVNRKFWPKEFEVFENEKKLLAAFKIKPVENFLPQKRTRIPIAIQTGCDCGCTFCLTKIARGPSHNFPVKEILANIQAAEKVGAHEIVLTGINLAAFGCSNSNRPEESKLAELLETILAETKIERIRLSSLDPQFLDKRFFKAFANPRICEYLHLSVQSGSDKILKKMGRHYSREKILRITKQAKKTRPNVALAADLIVGFPGETEKDFTETINLVREVGFAKLHVFPFSARHGTPAAKFPEQIETKVKKNRAVKLRQIGTELRRKFIEQNLGRELMILVEADETGLSTNFIRVKTPTQKINSIHKIELAEFAICDF